jgi:hypothetical protein
MPSPFRKDQLSPEMAERYGLDRAPWGTAVLVLSVICAFAVVLGWIGVSMASGVRARVLTWDDSAPDHVTVELEVQRDGAVALDCVIRAQDRTHIDTGYATTSIAPGASTVRISYALRTIAPAFTVEVLGCAPPGELRVAPPQFPPGVVAPSQPYSE